MVSDTAQRPHTRQGLDALAAELHEALDGFPASELLSLCHDDGDAAPGTQVRTDALVDQTLCAWIHGLDQVIDSQPGGTVEAIAQMRRKLVRSRDALIALHLELEKSIH